MKTVTHRRLATALIALAVAFVADRIIKTTIAVRPDIVSATLGPVSIRFEANPGFAFSISFPNTVVVILSLLVTVIFLVLLVRAIERGQSTMIIGVSAVLIGALSNMIDRVSVGYVIDYLAISFLPVFNIADLLILNGALILVWRGKIGEALDGPPLER